MNKRVIPCMQHPSFYRQEFFLSWIMCLSGLHQIWHIKYLHFYCHLTRICLTLSCQQVPGPTDVHVPGPSSCSSTGHYFWVISGKPGDSPDWSPFINPDKLRLVVILQKKEYNVKPYAAKCLLLLFRISSAFFPYLGIPNRLRKKNEAKPASSHVSKENDAPERMPPPPAVKSQ